MLEVKVVGQERAGVNSQACTFINRLYIANKYGLYISYGNSGVREFERFNPGKRIGSIRTTAIMSDRYRTVLICRNRVGVEGAGNLRARGVIGKLYGYRAIANADIFAALVQSEVLSA